MSSHIAGPIRSIVNRFKRKPVEVGAGGNAILVGMRLEQGEDEQPRDFLKRVLMHGAFHALEANEIPAEITISMAGRALTAKAGNEPSTTRIVFITAVDNLKLETSFET